MKARSTSLFLSWQLAACPLAIALVLPSLHAQLSTVTTATGKQTVRVGTQFLRTTATTADGRHFALVQSNDGLANGDASLTLEVHASSDGGSTWTRVTSMPQIGAVNGSVVCDPDGRTLHFAYEARLGNGHASIAYDAWDSVANKWSANAKILQTSTTANSQFLQPVIDATRDGRLIVSYYTHRQGPWTGQMQVGKDGNWTATARVNVDTYGVRIDHQVDGDSVWFAYRTNTGGYGIRARRYDLVASAWGAEGELEVSGKNSNIVGTANSASCIAVDRSGKAWVLWSSGGTSAGTGVLWLSAKSQTATSFDEHYKVDDDAPILGGNNNYDHFTLSLDDGGRVNVVYSLLQDQRAKLYLRFPIGTQLSPRLQLATGVADDFTRMNGARRSDTREPLFVQVENGLGSAARILVRGSGSVVPHVVACSGSGAQAPRLTTDRAPSLGVTLGLELAQLGANSPGVLFVGVDNKNFGPFTLPLPLDALGFANCFLAQTPIADGAFVANASGSTTVAFPYPNLGALRGVPIFWQGFVVAPGANAGGALLTNGVATIAR